jgi:hypothetical protein
MEIMISSCPLIFAREEEEKINPQNQNGMERPS